MSSNDTSTTTTGTGTHHDHDELALTSASSSRSSNTFFPLLDLPSVVLQRVVSFVDLPSRLKLCLTCKHARNEVDAHSKKVHLAIPLEHRVDAAFQRRVRTITRRETTTITRRGNSVVLPARYLSTKSMSKYLCEFTLPNDGSGLLKMVLSPSEGRIAIHQGRTVHLCDTATKQQVAVLAFQGNSNYWKLFFLDEKRILSFGYNHAWMLWSESETTGEWHGEAFVLLIEELPMHWDIWDAIHLRDEIIVFLYDATDTEGAQLLIVAININTKAHRQLFKTNAPENGEIEAKHKVVDNKWLLFSSEWDSLYICNLMTGEVRRLLGDFSGMIQASDCANTFYVSRGSGLDVLKLTDDGVFPDEPNKQIPMPRARRAMPFYRYQTLRAAVKSHVLVHNGGKIEMYDTATGEYRLCSANRRGVHGVISKQRNEIFIAHRAEDRISVKSFCLNEPNVM